MDMYDFVDKSPILLTVELFSKMGSGGLFSGISGCRRKHFWINTRFNSHASSINNAADQLRVC